MRLADVRAQFPQYNDLSDEQLADALHRRFYADLPREAVLSRLGVTAEPRRRPGLIENVTDIGTAAVEGAGQTGRSLLAAGQALVGANRGVERTAAAAADAQRNSQAEALTGLKQDIAQRQQANDGSVWQGVKNVAGAIADNPAGLPQLISEQLPNAAVALGSGFAGFKAGAAAAPFLGPLAPLAPIAGGVIGLFLGNTALETGGKAIEKAGDGFTPQDRRDSLREGAVKGAVVTGVDAVTFGATKMLYSGVGKAMEAAGVDVLTRAGVNVADAAAVARALETPAIKSEVAAAQAQALKAANAGGRGAARGAAAIGLQSVGEGTGEGLGEFAATGEFSPTDAALEAVAGLGQSAAEVSIAKSMAAAKRGAGIIRGAQGADTQGEPSLDQQLAELERARDAYLGVSKPVTETVNEIVNAPDIDSAIAAAAGAAGDVPATARRMGAALAPAMDRQADLAATAAAAPTEFDRRSAQEQAQVALAAASPAATGVADQFVDLTPMNPRQAQQRLVVLRDQVAREGGDALSLAIVPHPAQAGALAIGRRQLPSLDLPAATPAPVAPAEAQQRLEAADLGGRETRRKRLDEGRQVVVTRALRNVEERGGVASPQEAQIFQEAGLGRPYDRVDESLAPAPGLSLPRFADAPAPQPGQLEVPAARGERRDPNRLERMNSSVELTPTATLQATTSPGAAAPRPAGIDANAPLERATPRDSAPTDISGLELVPMERPQPRIERSQQEESDLRLARLERRRAVEAEARDQNNAAALTPTPPTAPNIDALTSILKKSPVLHNAQERVIVNEARQTLTPAQFDLVQRAAVNPPSLSATERLQLRRLREGDIRFSEQRPDSDKRDATSQGERLDYSHSESQVVDPAALPEQNAAGPGRLSKQQHRFLKILAGLFGKKVVVFRSDRADAPDGYVLDSDSRTIYINENSEQSQLVVFGHELLHQIRADNPKAYEAIRSVIRLRQGANLDVAGIRGDMEEVTADLMGNLFADTSFWREVFGQLTQAEAVRLGDTIAQTVGRFIRALRGVRAFDTDQLVENLQDVRTAAAGALAQYAREQRGAARQQRLDEGAVDTSAERVDSAPADRQDASPRTDTVTESPTGDVRDADTAQTSEEQLPAEQRRRLAAEAARRNMGLRFSTPRTQDDVRGQQPQVVPGQRAAPGYGTPQRDSVSVRAWHFSQASRPALSGAAYGSGLRGSGRDQFLNAEDPRSRQRIYFYVDKGQGIHPEAGVGGFAHEVELRNVYDADQDPRGLKRGGDWQAFESAVLDAGFDGYLYRDHNLSAAAVLLGPRTVPVAYRGQGRGATQAGGGVVVENRQAVWQTQASGLPARMQAELERMRSMPAWRNYDLRLVEERGFARVETRKRGVLLNIGLSTQEVAGGGSITEADVRREIDALGVDVLDLELQQSDSEQTAVVTIDRALSADEGDSLSVALQQQAIVQRMPEGGGELFGPMADTWGPYDASMFVLPGGARDVEPGERVRAAAKRRSTQAPGKEVPTSVDRVADSAAAFRRARGKVFETNRELKMEIQDAVRAAAEDAGVDLSTFSEETEKYLVRIATAEAVKALRENANAIGWYREKVTKALRIAALKHPELNTDPESRMVFIWALAVTSNGMRVKKNFELADKAYSSWKRYKKFPTNIGQGTAKKAINNGLRAYNVLSKKMTFDQLHNAMLTKSSVAQIGKLLGIKPSGEYADTIVYGSAILGPKVGNGFFANLYGHYEQLTIDRWLMRTWGRWTGTLVEVKPDVVAKKADTLSALLEMLTTEQRTQLEQAIGRTVYLDDLEPTAAAISAATSKESVRDALDEVGPLDNAMRARLVEVLGKEKANSRRVSLGDEIRKAGIGLYQAIDGQVEAPRDPQQRNDMRKVFDQVLAELQKTNPGLTMSDLQAVLWYPEKRIYDAAKTDKETDDGYEDGAAPDYANAAAEHYRGRGVAKSAIDRVVAQVDSELQAADGAGSGGRSAGGVAQQPGRVADPAVRASAKRQTDTPEFKRWFGDSKVVDENGEPLVVYHGTREDFSVFDDGMTADGAFHFGTVKAAEDAVFDNPDYEEDIDRPSVMPVYLSIKKPMRVKDQADNWAAAIARAKRLGHDGIVYRNEFEDKGSDSYIAFRPEQIKSAIGNNGQFDPTNPDIRASEKRWTDKQIDRAVENGFSAYRARELRAQNEVFKTLPKDVIQAIQSYWRADTALVEDDGRTRAVSGPLKGAATRAFKRARDAISTVDPSVQDEPGNLSLYLTNYGADLGDYLDSADQDRRSEKRAPFFSALERGVGTITTKAAPAAGWKDAIKGLVNKGVVKQDEVDWSGVNEWLDLQGAKVTKQEVEDYLRGNGVRVEEVTLGAAPLSRDEKIELTRLRRQWDAGNMPDEKFERMQKLERRVADNEERPTRYGQYTLPGGENYREVLLTLPVAEPTDDELRRYIRARHVDSKIGGELDPEELAYFMDEPRAYFRDKRDIRDRLGKKQYETHHWDQPNILAHIRLNDRRDSDGRRVLFVEEIQSDWAQEGKKKGFQFRDDERAALEKQLTDLELQKNRVRREGFRVPRDGERMEDTDPNFLKYQQLQREYDAVEKKLEDRGLPARAPFVDKTDKWVALALKRVVAMAAQEGYDRVAFVNGDQSAERYDLSKQIRKITGTVLPDGKLQVDTEAINGEGPSFIAESEQDLADKIGKEPAERLMKKFEEQDGEDSPGRQASISGLDLKVGGEGMKAFYDKIVPAVAKDVLKKLGGSGLTEVPLILEKSKLDEMSPEDRMEAGQEFAFDPDAMAELRRPKQEMVWQPGFDVTPAMREKVAGGLPLFSAKRSTPENVFGREIAPLAIRANARLSGEALAAVSAWNVNWETGRLERAFAEDNAVAREIRQAFAPVREKIREIYGDAMPLYRGERVWRGQRTPDREDRVLLSWSPSIDVARKFALNDNRVAKLKRITDAEIDEAVRKYEKYGFVQFNGYKYIRSRENPEYFNIYRGRNLITDGDDLERVLRNDQRDRNEFLDGARDGARLFRADVPVDDLVWVPVGANLTEPEVIARYNPRVRESEQMSLSTKRSAPRNLAGQLVNPVWQMPEDSKREGFIYRIQDKFVDLKRAIEAIGAAGRTLDEDLNAYEKEMLYHGRAAKQSKDFIDFELRPMLEGLKNDGIELKDFEDYLHNRHAEERNRQVASLDGGMQDGGSGILTADARAYLAAIPASRRAKLEAAARKVDAIAKGTREYLVQTGLETRETIDAWERAYQFYVPLNRAEYEAIEGSGTGLGYSVRGPASKRAMGSEKAVSNIIANLARQREAAIVRAEKNRVGMALYGMLLKHPNPDIALPVDPDLATRDPAATIAALQRLGVDPIDADSIVREPLQRTVIGDRVVSRVNPALRNNDNVLALRVNGEDKFIFFSQTEDRAQRLVKALKNLDAPALGQIMSTIGVATRWLAQVNTQYNPVFGIFNFARDFGGAMVNLTSTPLDGAQAQVGKDALSALRGIYADLRAHRAGTQPTSQWAQLFEEFQQEGGQTGFRDLFTTPQDRQADIRRLYDPSSWADEGIGKFITADGRLKAPIDLIARRGGGAVFNWLSDFNESIENALRLAAYKAAKDRGMTKQQAALLAKNLTVNFNKKGELATQAGALYAFFNAAVQGTDRLRQTLQGKRGKQVLYGGLLMGALQALAMAAAGYDEDEPPEFVRDRSLVVPTGDGKYVAIPLPLGLHVLPAVGRRTVEFTMRGFKDPAGYAFGLLNLLADAFNPLGGGGDVVTSLTPSVADPAVALARNQDWTGKPIAREDISSLNPTPGHTRSRDTATFWSQGLAEFFNWASGGTEFTPGKFSPTADQIDYLIGQVFGGVGRELSKVSQTAQAAATGEELPTYKIPLVGRLVGNVNEAAAERTRYFDNLRQLNIHQAEIKGRREQGQSVSDYLRENPDARLVSTANTIEREIREMNQRKRDLIERGASRETVRLLDQRIAARMKQFNDRVRALEERAQ